MKNSKKTIKRSIFSSHILVIAISVFLTSLVFNICLNMYMKFQTRSQLISAGQIIQKSMSTELFNTSITGFLKEERDSLKMLLKINRILKQTQTFLDIKYAVSSTNENLIFPKDLINEEEDLIKKHILPQLEKSNSFIKNKSKVLYFSYENKRYAVLFHSIKEEDNRKLGTLILYSELNNSKKILITVNVLLLSILLFTSAIALFISNAISHRISTPISNLSKYARKIGERDYMPDSSEYDEDEIGELAATMKTMAEKLSAYDNTIKTFFQNASHELRTPLMSIQGYAEGIKYGVIDDRSSAVEIIIDESKRLTTIVEDLLYLSKLDSFQETIKPEALIAEDLLKSCIERVNGIALHNKIKINTNFSDKKLILLADEEKLTRAIINILGNCLRYAKTEVNLSLNKDNSNLIITIEDDGAGFNENELGRIFDRFFKGTNGKYGLGLAITKSIIEMHNGTIVAKNTSKGGACFIIILTINE